MGTETTTRFSEQTIKQVRLDSNRAIARARFCTEQSETIRLRCVDYRPETEVDFGSQLWYFDGIGVDQSGKSHNVHGVIEYSTQFGLNELVEDGVYDSEHQRDKFRHNYEREVIRPSWRQPAHRWLLAGMISVTSLWLVFLLMRTLSI